MLLRMTLCVLLIANGVGSAQVSVRMALEHSSSDTMVMAGQGATKTAPCHRASESIGMTSPSAPVGEHASNSHDKPDPMGCCKGKACHCTFVQCVTTAYEAPAPAPAFVDELLVSPLLTIDYPQPRLPPLIRPPIG